MIIFPSGARFYAVAPLSDFDLSALQRLASSAESCGVELGEVIGDTSSLYTAHGIFINFIEAATPALVLSLLAEIERLKVVEDAFNVFIEKTNWVQTTAQPHELGLHRADVLRDRILALEAK